MRKIKMGVIGMGFIGPVHADAVAMNWDIATPFAVADDDVAKHQSARDRGLKVYSTAEELIADKEVEAVHIAGPDSYHAQWAIDAMDAGKKVVVCEKPMTVTLDDSVRVLERAIRFEADTGGVFMTNINYMGHALPRAARQFIAAGELGDIAIIKATYEQDWLMNPDMWTWRLEGKMCASKDILPHLISAAYFMGGIFPTELITDHAVIVPQRQKPKSGRGDAFGGGAAQQTEAVNVESDLYSSILCDFNNGAKGNFMVTQYLAGRQNWWEITIGGSKRRITWNQTDPNRMEIGQRQLEGQPVYRLQDLANLTLINNPGNLAALGFKDAAQYSPYPGEHPAGHIDAFAKNFRTAYRVAMGQMPRDQAVISGALIGHVCVAVADAVLRSRAAGRNYVKVDYKGVDLKAGKL